MALYSFAVRKKGEEKYSRSGIRHELAFLDYLSMQFNNKEELIRFLLENPEQYDDIVITYRHNNETKIIPVYFDAVELKHIVNPLIDFGPLAEADNIYYQIARAYKNPSCVKVETELEETEDFDKIMAEILYDNRFKKAYNMHLINKKACEYAEDNFTQGFIREMLSSYLNIRKAYAFGRKSNYIKGNARVKNVPPLHREEIIRQFEAENPRYMPILDTTPYENILFARIINGDESAYEELMAFDIERLEYLKPILDYLGRYKGNHKK